MILDPLFYAVAIPAILIFGISKSAFGGGLGIIAVPVMALVVDPIFAAAIMLPIMILMDAFTVRAYWGIWEPGLIPFLLPAALVGVGIGAMVFSFMSVDVLKAILGVMAVTFTVYQVFGKWLFGSMPKAPKPVGVVAAVVSGFTSHIAHAGGPPMSFYLLPLNLDPKRFVGTTIIIFSVVNLTKLFPYALSGLFTEQVMWTSLVMAPLAPLGVWLGFWLNRVMTKTIFYRTIYVLLFLTGVKLLNDAFL